MIGLGSFDRHFCWLDITNMIGHFCSIDFSWWNMEHGTWRKIEAQNPVGDQLHLSHLWWILVFLLHGQWQLSYLIMSWSPARFARVSGKQIALNSCRYPRCDFLISLSLSFARFFPSRSLSVFCTGMILSGRWGILRPPHFNRCLAWKTCDLWEDRLQHQLVLLGILPIP